MALSVAQHAIGDVGSSDDYVCRVMDMAVTQPLIIMPKGENRVLRIHARHNTEKKAIRVTYESTSEREEKRTTHATCTVEYGLDNKSSQRWTRSLHLVQSRMCELEALVNQGKASKLSNGLAYRLFQSLVDYTADYRRMEGILFASQSLEASAMVRLDRRKCDEGFVCSPYWIDSLCHISGFVMNANDTINTQEIVYISHGWESMWFRMPLTPDTAYRTYVKMCHVEKSVVSGDVWILHEGEVAGVVEGLQFQRIPRSVLDILLPKATCTPADKQVSAPYGPNPEIIPEASKAIPAPGSSWNTIKFKHLIADVLGIPETEIRPDDSLSELGMDYLACSTLASNLMDSFGVEFSNSKMMECTTIGQLMNLASNSGVHISFTPSNSDDQTDSLEERTPITPSTDTLDQSLPCPTDGDRRDAMSLIISTIVEESGIHESGLDSDVELGDLGIDSLMILTVVGKLRAVGVDLPLDFFHKHRTMGDVTRALTGPSVVEAEGIARDRSNTNTAESSPALNVAKLIPIQAGHKPRRPLRLFLFPDGSGSPGAHVKLGDLHPAFEVYGLVCPFINDPDNCTCGIEDLVRMYLETVRKEQPAGPYYLGGWSVGGVLAFEAAKQLHATGQEIRLLILLDAPCPAVIPPMPTSFIDHLEAVGVLPSTKLKNDDQRRRVMRNFNKTVNQLSRYKPKSFMQSEELLHTVIVCAKDGVSPTSASRANEAQPDGSIQRWILENRTDFCPSGWEELLPRARIAVTPVSGNHFSMMESPNVRSCNLPLLAGY
jgi:iterative type I PKS product template protein